MATMDHMTTLLATSLLSSESGSQEPEERQPFVIADIVFSCFFALSFILVLAMSVYNFCHFPNMVNLPNVLVVILLLLLLLSK